MHTHETQSAGSQPQTSAPAVNPLVSRHSGMTDPEQERVASPTNPFPRRPHEVWSAEPVAPPTNPFPRRPHEVWSAAPSTPTPSTPGIQPKEEPSGREIEPNWQQFSLYASGQTPPDPPQWNRGVTRKIQRSPVTPEPYWYQGPPVQAKLTVGEPNDAYEQEADQVAAQVMTMPDPAASIQRMEEPETEETPGLQTKAIAESITPLLQRQAEDPDKELVQPKCETCEQEEPIQRSSDSSTSTPTASEPQPTPEIQRAPNGMPPKKGTTKIVPKAAKLTASGKNITEAINNLTQQGKGEAGSVTCAPGWTPKTYQADDNSDEIVYEADVVVTETKAMPVWTELDQQCEPVKKEWARFYSALDTHENGHISIDEKAYKDLHKQLLGKKQADADKIFDKTYNQANTDNDTYDAATQHGLTQGTAVNPVQCGLEKVSQNQDASGAEPLNQDVANPEPAVQAKLTVGNPNDAYEQEADRVAAQVMAMPEPATSIQRIEEPETEDTEETPALQTKAIADTITPLVQRQSEEEDEPQVQTKCEACEQEDTLQRSPDAVAQAQPDLEHRLNSSKGGGSPLPSEVRSYMEPRFGADFSQVRVHTGSDAVQMNRELNAQAFTCRSDIYYGDGKSPGTNDLTAHELTHVVQQTGAQILRQKLNNDRTQRVPQHQSLWVQRVPGAPPVLGFQKQPIIDALNKKPEPDYAEAYRLLNVLAMFDILSTLNSLKRSGQFDKLNSNLGKAVGVNTPRLQIAFFAVQAKADNKTEDFMLRHGGELTTLPQDQRLDILNFIDAKWVDELKLAEDENALIGQIRANAVFLALAPDDKTLAEEIIAEAQKRRMKSFHSSVYCLEKLKLLFETPEEDPSKQSATTQASTDTATKQEKDRLSKPAAVKQLDLEEKASKKSSKKMIPVKGKDGGGTYYVDNSDPTHIVVKAKIFLQVTTNGDAKNIENSKKTIASIKKMEDAIEKAASTKGYLVDIVFIKAPDPDMFTVEVDPSGWPGSTNWAVGNPAVLAHELHHLMAFPLDRYDYIAFPSLMRYSNSSE